MRLCAVVCLSACRSPSTSGRDGRLSPAAASRRAGSQVPVFGCSDGNELCRDSSSLSEDLFRPRKTATWLSDATRPSSALRAISTRAAVSSELRLADVSRSIDTPRERQTFCASCSSDSGERGRNSFAGSDDKNRSDPSTRASSGFVSANNRSSEAYNGCSINCR